MQYGCGGCIYGVARLSPFVIIIIIIVHSAISPQRCVMMMVDRRKKKCAQSLLTDDDEDDDVDDHMQCGTLLRAHVFRVVLCMTTLYIYIF